MSKIDEIKPVVTKDNHNDIDQFIKDNLSEFNKSQKPFEFNKIKETYKALGFSEESVISATMIRKKLNENYRTLINDEKKKQEFEKCLKEIKATKIPDAKDELRSIALEYSLGFDKVDDYYKSMIRQAVIIEFENERKAWEKDMLKRLIGYANSIASDSTLPGKYIKDDYKKCLGQIEYWLTHAGFSQNLTNEVRGQDVANQGDSAQFLFVGRAMLAGFNCSNVDVRSSPYDAIISKPNSNGKAFNLKTVQIKGIMTKTVLSLKKRARGGSGSDSSTGRNAATFLSPDDADLLVAVDKQFGICYIIPMDDVENKIASGESRITWAELEEKYKERWDYI